MRHAPWFGLAIVAALVVTAAPASAQLVLKFDIPFEFVVEGHTTPAGTYQVVPDDAARLRLLDANGNAQALVPVTRLSLRVASAIPDELIFDKIGGQNILSEVWYTGEDGYLMAATTGIHTHLRVRGSKK